MEVTMIGHSTALIETAGLKTEVVLLREGESWQC